MNSFVIDRSSNSQPDHIPAPAFWRWFLRGINIGKAAVGGAGFGVALSGLVNVGIVLATSATFSSVEHTNSHLLVISSIICAAIGAIAASYTWIKMG